MGRSGSLQSIIMSTTYWVAAVVDNLLLSNFAIEIYTQYDHVLSRKDYQAEGGNLTSLREILSRVPTQNLLNM